MCLIFFFIEKGWCTSSACGVIILMGAFIMRREREKRTLYTSSVSGVLIFTFTCGLLIMHLTLVSFLCCGFSDKLLFALAEHSSSGY